MASPSNKKDGSSYLASLTKEKLIEKYIDLASQLSDAEMRLDKKEEENLDLLKQLDKMKKKCDRYFTKDEIVKKILEYKARNLVPIQIREKLVLDGFNIDLSTIKNIYNGELSLENEAFYQECVEKWVEAIKINTKYYKQSSIDEINRLVGYAYEDLEACDKDDIPTRLRIRDSISNYIEKRDKLMKNIDETATATEEEEYMNQTFEDYKETSDKIIKLTSVKAIGE